MLRMLENRDSNDKLEYPVSVRFSVCLLVWMSLLSALIFSVSNLRAADEPAAADSALAADAVATETLPDYLRDIRPILERSCYSCHGSERQRSGLRLDRRSSVLKGGDLGLAIVPHDSAASPLLQYVAGSVDGLKMPPEGEALSVAEIELIKRWIDTGANWPDADANEPSDNESSPWSLRELQRPAVPITNESADAAGIHSPVDAFVLAKLQERSLQLSPEADRQSLIRRVTLDLHGLQPSPAEVTRFMSDTSPDAWELLIDRLLESPRYGERWARHWLDVVHYADSHGQDQDRPRPNAWPYRDYLIRALNDDLPYATFVQQQLAGDVLFPDDPLAIAATGFLAAGPWDESSLQSIREDSIDRLIGQNLDRDDIVTSTASTFLGLTVGCARCHDHKFDPVSQQDYYGLQAVFSGIDKAERQYDADPQTAIRRRTLTQQLAAVSTWTSHPSAELLSAELAETVAAFEVVRGSGASPWTILEPVQWSATQGTVLKPLLDRSVLAVGMRPDKDTYVVTSSTDLPVITAIRLELLTDETLPMLGPGRQDNGNLHLSEVRVRVHSRQDQASSPAGAADTGVTNIPIREATADFSQVDWGVEKSVDGNAATAWGIHPEVGKPHVAVFVLQNPVTMGPDSVITVELDQQHGTGHLIGRFRLSATDRTPTGAEIIAVPQSVAAALNVSREQRSVPDQITVAAWLEERRLRQELASLPSPLRVYCGTAAFAAEGSFRPATSPRPVYVLTRGDISRPAEPALPSALLVLDQLVGPLELSKPEDEGQRRAALARWITASSNPLTWRVIVNRVWHHHFGRGLVDTPNDFGKMGGLPSHPELLDWLAVEFRDGGGSLKQLHRMLLTSRVYRQASTHNPQASVLDGDNRLLWKMNRRRLDAESVRDSLLQISGRLDDTMYGPPVMQFRVSPGKHVTPMADYLTFDVDSAESRRRSIYRFIFRTLPDPWLDSLDCPDASQSAPVRGDSVGALQALALWNNKLTLRQAEHLAALAQNALPDSAEIQQDSESPDAAAQQVTPDLSQQIQFVCQRILCRQPTEAEQSDWGQYAQQFGLANLCRVLLNSSEFLFVD